MQQSPYIYLFSPEIPVLKFSWKLFDHNSQGRFTALDMGLECVCVCVSGKLRVHWQKNGIANNNADVQYKNVLQTYALSNVITLNIYVVRLVILKM